MADKLMHIPNYDTQNTPFIEYNFLLKHLDTKINKSPQSCQANE